jgi:beta-lactamase superfamily II metal-dependent hydrolase
MHRSRLLLTTFLFVFLLTSASSGCASPPGYTAAPQTGYRIYLPLIAYGPPLPSTPLQVHMINVGQGNSYLVVAPSGKTMLIDTGEASKASVVANYLQSALGVKAVDYVVITHYHADHLGAFTALLNTHGLVIRQATYDRGGSRTEYNSAAYTNYYDLCTTTNPTACKRSTLREGNAIDLGPMVQAKVLCIGDWVTKKTCGQSVISENDNSALILLSMGSFDIWLGGDTSGDTTHTSYADVENAVVSQGKINQTLDVYAVDHHGSCTSSNQTLIDATHPTVSVFSLGANSYGHPCPATVNRLTTAGSTLYYTENASGAVVDGNVKIEYTGGFTYTVTTTNGMTTFNTK